MIAEIDGPSPDPDCLLGLRPVHFGQSSKSKIVQVATNAASIHITLLYFINLLHETNRIGWVELKPTDLI
jgi:hypothetical protein